MEIASYRRQGAEYDVLSRLIVSGEEDIRLLIDYSEGDGTRPNRLRSNLRKMRTILDNLAVRCTVRCSATTTYEFGDVTSLIALPFMRFPSSQFYFDEIRGVRFVRSAENGDEVDSVALDMDGQNHLHLYAMTSFDDIASARIPMIALRHLIALRAKVVEVN